MRAVLRGLWLVALVGVCAQAIGAPARPVKPAPSGKWRQVHPQWQRAYIFSFRSPDLLSSEADEHWGKSDNRLVSGMILSDFPVWLGEHREAIEAARADGRPILLSIHVHSGYGTGLVTYNRNLTKAEVATYPWLVRQLMEHGLAESDVTVAVDTCNAQATAAHQLRPDLIPAGVAAWSQFARWRNAHPARKSLSTEEAYRLFSADRVRQHLAKRARGDRRNVDVAALQPLSPSERREFRARLYGPRGVILATPAFFNLLRLGYNTSGTLTANLLTAPLSGQVVDSLLPRNKAEFKRFTEFAFLNTAGLSPNTARRPEPEDAVRGYREAGRPHVRPN